MKSWLPEPSGKEGGKCLWQAECLEPDCHRAGAVAESHLSSTFGMHFTLESGRDLTVPLLLCPDLITH